MKLIGLAGKMGSGKDTVASILANYGYVRHGFADSLRGEVADAMFHSDIFTPECLSPLALEAFRCATTDEVYRKPTTPRMRALLQEWGTEFRRAQREDYWVSIMRKKLAGLDRACISDVRFADEAALVREMGGKVWIIERPGTGDGIRAEHVSEAIPFHPDHIIHNTGTIEQLAAEVSRVLSIQEMK